MPLMSLAAGGTAPSITPAMVNNIFSGVPQLIPLNKEVLLLSCALVFNGVTASSCVIYVFICISCSPVWNRVWPVGMRILLLETYLKKWYCDTHSTKHTHTHTHTHTESNYTYILTYAHLFSAGSILENLQRL